jgi:hypothetical protein
LITRKGEAAPAAVGTPRQKLVAITVKLTPALYVRLKAFSVRTDQHKTNQDILVDALEQYLQAHEA